MSIIIGIDIAKLKFDGVVLLENGKQKHKIFTNDSIGFEACRQWLKQLGLEKVHACLEATGHYGEACALFLHEQGHTVSIINPARIKAYAKSEGVRTKTDKVDAATIARFCKAQCPPAWTPPSPVERELKELYRCLQGLLEDRTKIMNRLEKQREASSPVTKVWKHMLATVEKQILKVEKRLQKLVHSHEALRAQVVLLSSIPGIGTKTAIAVLAELPSMESFQSAKEVAAYAGLTPSVHQSGSSVNGRGKLSKVGNPRLRKALYMPAVVAQRYNPLLKAFCQRLADKGKCKMVILAAVMRKLLHIMFGVLKTKTNFSPVMR